MTAPGLGRRRVLGAGAALAASTVAGCSGIAPGASAGRVVVVGGGYGGATAARYLKLWGGSGVDVTLVERNAAFVSCPLSNLVLGGYRQMADITLGYDGLRAAGVTLLHDEAVAVDVPARKLHLADGSTLRYERLVLSPGVDFMPEAIAGLGAALDSGRVLHAWKAGPQTVAIFVPKAPYRCPPGPYERACVVASYLQMAKPRAKLLLLDANPEITSKKALFEAAFERYAGLLEYRPNAELKELTPTLARLDFEDVRADVLNVIPPQRAGDLARRAGLVTVNERWVGVDWLTLQSTVAPDIHVLGDATFAAPAMPKSGHLANQHAKVAAAAILRSLQGQPVNATPVMMNTCYSFVSGDEAMHVASVHQWDAAEKTLKPVSGAGGVSALASRAEARYAMGWAQNIWADTLAL
ncbi:MAG TPA: NAD(P)/FAD-dependent oxidoreductase [Rubrivivax sp.]|nr:NAD(P)/FAD-dependent oxidoreductase [Rubrivivax sp.]